uniref:Polymerase nucleotidyl transferase domain-containing protein n=1 Tax=viral metagenome TaxID=1070528 RepID=A0A6C0E3P3_9ZZZZ
MVDINYKTDLTKTKNKLPDSTTNFLNNLSEYLQTPLYFYGSIQRYDYFPGKSDIDIDIFTDNEKSTISKLSNYLQIDKKKFKRVVWKNDRNRIIYGYKKYYTNESLDLKIEFAIYNEKYKKDVLESHEYKTNLPLHIVVLLYLLKFVYYKLHMIDSKMYRKYKGYILTDLINYKNHIFVTI